MEINQDNITDKFEKAEKGLENQIENEKKNGEEIEELEVKTDKGLKENENKEVKGIDRDRDFELKNGKYVFKKGNKIAKDRKPHKPFSLKEDLIKSLKRIKKTQPDLYKKIIDSYWADGKMRQFLFEVIDGKARQSVEMSGTMSNPIRIIEVREEKPKNEV